MLAPRRAMAMLAGLAFVVAGCAAPPAQQPGVAFVNAPASGNAGQGIELSFRVANAPGAVSHSDVHFAMNGNAMPGPGVETQAAAATPAGDGTYRATVPAAAAGTLTVRAHVIAGGQELYSPAHSITISGTGAGAPRFTDVNVPTEAEAGVPFRIAYRLDGSGSTTHVGAHFSTTSSRNLPPNFAAGSWQGLRSSQHLGVPDAVSLPADIAVDATAPTPGTWYLRPHLLLGNVNHWADEVTIAVGNPRGPNIVLLNATTAATAGQPAAVTFALNSAPGTSSHVGAHFSNTTSAGLPANFPAANWSSARTAPHHGTATPVSVPGVFTVNITFPLPGPWFYRGHASVAGQPNVWSEEVAVQVTAPASPRVVILGVNGDLDSPTDHTLSALQVQPVTLEWAVIVPEGGTTNHTHAHHGPQSVAQPAEGAAPGAGYPGTSALQQGSIPGIFRGNFTPPAVQGMYHLRAMAIVPGADGGPPVEVWSDEWTLNVQLRP